MRWTTIGVAVAAATLAGCTTGRAMTAAAAPGAPVAGEEIRYETSPCYGTCPVYAISVRPDGTGTFEGMRHTAVTGTRSFTATPEQYRRFAAALAPYRPAQGEALFEMGSPLCGGPMVSDMPGVDVRWSTPGGGAGRRLSLYYGCGTEAMRAAVRGAPDALPVAGFIRPAGGPR